LENPGFLCRIWGQPAAFGVTWDEIRPKAVVGPGEEEPACLADPAECAMIPMDVLGIEKSRE
jgi:hypothetical protein